MRIATMVTGHFACPPPKGIIYAPMFIAQSVAEGLARKKHKVFFFGPLGSKMKAAKVISNGFRPLHGKKDHPIMTDPDVRGVETGKIACLWDQYLVSLIYRKALRGEIDIIHIHPADMALPFGLAIENIPVVYTLHDPVYRWRATVFRTFQSKNQYFISLSNAQRKPAPDLRWIDTIYNGLDLKKFPFSKKPKNQLLFLGRILPVKGPDIAIQAAKTAGEKLVIAGAPNQGRYWDEKIKPYLGKDVQYAGNISYEKTYKYYGLAKALLCPIQWEEPFGLTLIEAMACGTPVIAFDRGSVREIIKDGKTGFIVKNVNEMVGAIKKIDRIDRENCRKHVEKNFTIERMVGEYEKAFYKILSRHQKIK